MPFMGGIASLWLLAALLIVAGLAAAIAVAFGDSSNDGDDAHRILRARFARGEIDAEALDKAKATLGADPTGRKAPRRLLIVAIGLLIVAALAAWLASAVAWSPGGMMGGMMGMMGAGPTAPPDTSVTMAGARFTPATIPIHAGGTVRSRRRDASHRHCRGPGVGFGLPRSRRILRTTVRPSRFLLVRLPVPHLDGRHGGRLDSVARVCKPTRSCQPEWRALSPSPTEAEADGPLIRVSTRHEAIGRALSLTR